MKTNYSPAELVQAYVDSKALVESLALNLQEADRDREALDSKIRRELIEPNEHMPLLVEGRSDSLLVHLVGGYLQVSPITKL